MHTDFSYINNGLEIFTLGVAAGPAIRSQENGIATAIVVDGIHYMVDFGLGCTRAAHEAGLRGRNFRAGFITHLHSDHIAELPGYLLWNWGAPVDGFTKSIDFYGPGPDPDKTTDDIKINGTFGLIDHLTKAFNYDAYIRVEDEGRPPLKELIHVSELQVPSSDSSKIFNVYEDERIAVTAVLVDHPPVFPAVAYRFDTAYGSVVISGDTAESESLAVLARDADVLIHEAVNLEFYRNKGFSSAFIAHQENSHTSPQGAGRVASRAGVQHLVLSHLAGQAPQNFWKAAAQETFNGRITVATSGQKIQVPAPMQSRTRF